MNPTVLADLIRDELANLIDVPAWDDALATEDANRSTLANILP
jgi:hypothetical protein